ncbi:hypothetical protein D3C77_448060 [compost metagenome]
MADLMNMVLDFSQNALLLQVLDDLLAAFTAVHALVFTGCLIHLSALIHNGNLRQVMAKPYFKVIWIMGRRNFHRPAAKFLVNIIIGNNRDFPVYNRQQQRLTDQMAISLILGVNSNSCIA